MSINIEREVLEKYVAVQNATKCRKCKATDWELREKRDIAMGGTRVGIFVVLGSRDEEVAVIAFECRSCGALFPRPAYSRLQLAEQEFPAITLDVGAEDKKDKKPKTTKTTKTSRTTKTKRHGKGENGTAP